MTQLPQPPVDTPAAKPKSKTPIIVAIVIAVAVLAAGTVAAFTLLRGSSAAAAKGLPADAYAVVEVNLNPSASDKLALKSIADKVEGLDMGDFGTDYKAALWSLLPDDAPEYSEVQDWLGDSLAVAATPTADSDSGQATVISVQVTDEAKAKAFAEKNAPELSVFFVDDLMVLASQDAAATEQSIKDTPLSGNQTYTADLAKLTGSTLATAWVSPDGASQLAQEGLAEADASGLSTGDLLTGAHGAAGLQVSGDVVDLRAVFETPNHEAKAGADARPILKDLSGDALLAVAGTTDAAALQEAWNTISSDENMLAMAQWFGVQDADDLLAVLCTSVAATLDVTSDGEPVLGAQLVGNDEARQQEILTNLSDMMAYFGADGVEVEQVDGAGIIAFGQSAADVTSPAKTLGETSGLDKLFDTSASGLAYLNVDALVANESFAYQLDYSPEVKAWLEPMTGVALSGSQDGTTSEALLRVSFS